MGNSVYSADKTDAFTIVLGLLKALQECIGLDKDIVDLADKDMHSAVYKEKALHPDVYKSIKFNDDPTFPYSRQIEDALYELQVCGFLTRPNQTMAKYRLVGVRGYAEKKIDRALRDELNAAAERILND